MTGWPSPSLDSISKPVTMKTEHQSSSTTVTISKTPSVRVWCIFLLYRVFFQTACLQLAPGTESLYKGAQGQKVSSSLGQKWNFTCESVPEGSVWPSRVGENTSRLFRPTLLNFSTTGSCSASRWPSASRDVTSEPAPPTGWWEWLFSSLITWWIIFPPWSRRQKQCKLC